MNRVGYPFLVALTFATTIHCGSWSSYNKLMEKYEVQPLPIAEKKEEDGKTDFLLSLNTVADDSLSCQLPQDCTDIQECGQRKSGIYRVFPFGTGEGFLVFCDMQTRGGGWLVFQRRQDGSVDFARNWNNYTDGFGKLFGDFWLGLEKIHILTSQRRYELQVNMRKYDKSSLYAAYDRFHVSETGQKYRLLIGQHSGTAGDSLSLHNGCKFSTPGEDNDYATRHCAAHHGGGWWFNGCSHCHLNGVYKHVNKKTEKGDTGIYWDKYGGDRKPLQFVEMKMRPLKT